jgi:histone H3/H4
MPRKIKPTALAVSAIDPVTVKDDEKPTAPPAESTQELENTETTAEETSDSTTRRPRKKIRRPVLSDTISAIPVAAFHRLVREISADCKSDMRWEAEALRALQVDTEAYLVAKFQKARETLDLFGKSGKTVGDRMLHA